MIETAARQFLACDLRSRNPPPPTATPGFQGSRARGGRWARRSPIRQDPRDTSGPLDHRLLRLPRRGHADGFVRRVHAFAKGLHEGEDVGGKVRLVLAEKSRRLPFRQAPLDPHAGEIENLGRNDRRPQGPAKGAAEDWKGGCQSGGGMDGWSRAARAHDSPCLMSTLGASRRCAPCRRRVRARKRARESEGVSPACISGCWSSYAWPPAQNNQPTHQLLGYLPTFRRDVRVERPLKLDERGLR